MTATLHGWTPLSAGKVRDIYAPDEAVVGPAQEATPAEGRPRHAKAGPEALLNENLNQTLSMTELPVPFLLEYTKP